MKLLDLPTEAAHLLYDPRVVFHHVIGHDIVRALGAKHNPEEFPFMVTKKAFDLDCFAMLFLGFCLYQRVDALVWAAQAVLPPVQTKP